MKNVSLKSLHRPALGLLLALGASGSPSFAQKADPLAAGFVTPPERTKPRCYWYWMDGRVSKNGITKDLENMKKVGVGEAYIGIIGGQAGDPGTSGFKALTPEWWGLVEHAIREGSRIGVDIGVFNSPGWSQSGGPWITPQTTMRHVVSSEIHLHGPMHFEGSLPGPTGYSNDIATLAFPAPAGDTDLITAHAPKISGGDQVPRIFDGDMDTAAEIPNGPDHDVTLGLADPFTARSLILYPARDIRCSGQLQVSDDGVTFRDVRDFSMDRHNGALNVGPEPLAPISVSFPAATGRFFRLHFSGGGQLAEVKLSGAARVESFAEKQLSKVFQDPQPPFDFYTWPSQAEPEKSSFSIPTIGVQNISAKVVGDKLTWDVPNGDWVVMRSAMAPTGVKNSPAPPEATGLEVDKMSRPALKVNFDSYMGELLKRLPPADRKAWKHVVEDSYETGPQNWTDDMIPSFKARYGYDPTPYLPVFSGRIVGSAEQSNRFLWDVRRLVADRVADDYVGGLADFSHKYGLKTWLENYGHWGFPGEFLQYGSKSDEVGGEFWATGSLGSIELKDASSAAHIYGKPVTYAEAWTGGPLYTSTPWSLKRRGDWAFCQGINQFVLHVNISQPDDRRPGISAWFGTEFNRHNTWFPESKDWIDYLRRCHYMLQQGNYVADVAYFIGEDTPKMAGIQQPELPAGYSFDYINADVIENRLTVKNGRFVLPDGMSYRVIVLPDGASIRPATLLKLQEMVGQGGTVLGNPPTKSPSLENYPASDFQIKTAAAAIWGNVDGKSVTVNNFAKGHAFRGTSLQKVLDALGVAPDLSGIDPEKTEFIHRRTAAADIYFLSNQTDSTEILTPSFRVTGRAPELWDAVTGEHQAQVVYQSSNGLTQVPIHLTPRQSIFVVFRGAAATNGVTRVTQNGLPTLSAQAAGVEAGTSEKNTTNTFTMALWVKPTAETTMMSEFGGGVHGMDETRNEIIFPTQGDTFGLGAGHAGSGISVGTNGVSVFQHSAFYFVPILMYPTPIKDWTHVAVVYQDGQPSLYLNGKLVHTGLKSDHIVHPGLPNALFNGSISGFQSVPRALSTTDIQNMMKAGPESAATDWFGAPVEISQGAKGGVQVLAWQGGVYSLQRPSGKATNLTVPSLPLSTTLDGLWKVSFPANSGAPAQISFDGLTSLTTRTEPTIKYFSGTATYAKSFNVPTTSVGAGKRLYLDLGQVESLAEVIINGKSLGTLWQAPFNLNITSAVRPGANTLVVRVSNVWHNRLVGQQREPGAFAAPGVEQPWASVMPGYGADEPLFASGLIGPVKLRQAAVLTVK